MQWAAEVKGAADQAMSKKTSLSQTADEVHRIGTVRGSTAPVIGVRHVDPKGFQVDQRVGIAMDAHRFQG